MINIFLLFVIIGIIIITIGLLLLDGVAGIIMAIIITIASIFSGGQMNVEGMGDMSTIKKPRYLAPVFILIGLIILAVGAVGL